MILLLANITANTHTKKHIPIAPKHN